MNTQITITTAVLFMFTAISGFAQDIKESDVPTAVRQAFEQEFSNARMAEWERKGQMYEVEFNTGMFDDHEVIIDGRGNIIRHKEEIAKNDLPKAVLKSIQADYADYRVDDVDRITENGKVTYKVDLENRQGDMDIYLSEDGSEVSRY